MIDVFFCSNARSGDLREHMATMCFIRWRREPTRKNLHVVAERQTVFHVKANVVIEGKNMQMGRRVYAEDAAQSDIYCIADDDCFPQAEPFLDLALEIMENHPGFGALALYPENEPPAAWYPSPEERRSVCINGAIFRDESVLETHSCGGIVFYRKGAMHKWPTPESSTSFDNQHGIALRKHGFRVGYMYKPVMTHLGKGYSSHWRKK